MHPHIAYVSSFGPVLGSIRDEYSGRWKRTPAAPLVSLAGYAGRINASFESLLSISDTTLLWGRIATMSVNLGGGRGDVNSGVPS
jgi:hypothetical protein